MFSSAWFRSSACTLFLSFAFILGWRPCVKRWVAACQRVSPSLCGSEAFCRGRAPLSPPRGSRPSERGDRARRRGAPVGSWLVLWWGGFSHSIQPSCAALSIQRHVSPPSGCCPSDAAGLILFKTWLVELMRLNPREGRITG